MYLIIGDSVFGFELKCLQFCAFGPKIDTIEQQRVEAIWFAIKKKKITLKGSTLKFLFTLDRSVITLVCV